MNDVPRPEHPRPTCVRPRWQTLNGQWEFEIDQGDSGLERGLRDRPLTGQITVPFAPESAASGIGNTDFLEAVWYARDVAVPAEWAGQRVLLHFGAVDHDATVWADGVEVARHRGGFSSFSADLGERAGETVRVVVRARDGRRGVQARGKQATWYANTDCHYTRTTGIWQTVWLEAVPAVHLRSVRITPNLAAGAVTVAAPVTANVAGHRLVVALADADGPVASGSVRADLDLTPAITIADPAKSGCARGRPPIRTSTTSPSGSWTPTAPSSTRWTATPVSARCRSTGSGCCSTASRCSSGSCSTRAGGPTP